MIYSRVSCLRTTPFTIRQQCCVSLGSFLTGHEARIFLLHQKLIMDHHSFAFQMFLFLMFYRTFEWIRREHSQCTSVTQGQKEQEQTSDLTHIAVVVNETISQTDDSIVSTSTAPTDIQVHLKTEPETEPALHTSELVSTVQQTEEPVAVAAIEPDTELNAIAPIELVLAHSLIPTLPALTTVPAIPSFALRGSPDALFPTSAPVSEDSLELARLMTRLEHPIDMLFMFPLEIVPEASSIEPMTTAEVTEAVEIVPNLQPTGSLPKTSPHKKQQPRQTKKIKAVA